MDASHALVVGGTGMLRGVALELARRGHLVSVVARGGERLASLEREGGGRIHGVACDWHDAAGLERALREAASRRGPLTLAVVWIHSDAPGALPAVARAVAPGCRFFHVLGSSAADPSRADPARRPDGIAWREVILGFVVAAGGSRWLTDEEISLGVLRAIDTDASRLIVGTAEPWSARP